MIETVEAGGGGSMVAYNLFFLRCSMGKGWRPTNDKEGHPIGLLESSSPFEKEYPRLLLTIERYYIIGDRIFAQYSIKGNKLTVKFIDLEKPVTRIIKVAN